VKSGVSKSIGLFPAAVAALWACSSQPERSPETLDGAQLYVTHCAACHGDHGEGDGPVGAVLAVQVPNLRTLAERNGGVFPRAAVRAYIDGRSMPAAHGERYMPVWGDEFLVMEGGSPNAEARVEREISALVDFVAELQY
jgi:mono/diheme cytochrome c family protein